MSNNLFRGARWIAAAGATIALTTGAATAEATPTPTNPVAAATRAPATTPLPATIASVPRDFAATMGYQPQMIDAMVVNPTGFCSSPIPLPTAFDTACKAHDFGYDMIRYAAATGNAVDPQWRRTVDAQLGRRMHQACEGHVLCHGAASLATVALTVNSWRQHYGAPAHEPFLPLALGGAAAITAISALSIVDTRRRPSPRAAHHLAGAGAAG